MKKWFVIAGAVIIIIGAFLYLSAGTGDNTPDDLKTVKASKGELRLEVIARGSVIPDVEVIVKSKAGGEITSFPYNEGDNVKKGETTVKLDPKTERARANQAEANLLMAKARLDKARISLKDAGIKLTRQKKLFEDGIISKQELEDAQITVEKAQSDVKLSEAEVFQSKEALKEAEERLADTEIKAPFTGTILKKFVEAGQVISSTLSSASEGTQIFSMANLDNIYVNAQVDEVDISGVKVGQEASITVDSIPGRSFKGVVARIAPKGKTERTVTIFEVVIMITDDGKALLKPGMTSEIKILSRLIKDVLVVPNEALKQKENKTGVYILDQGRPKWVPVKTGETNGILTEVAEGLNTGQEVVISGIKANEKPQKKRYFF